MIKLVKPQAEAEASPKATIVPGPWSCKHEPAKSSIDAYISASGEWETIAEVPAQEGVDAKATAEFIVTLVNQGEQARTALRAALSAIDELRECVGSKISFSAEQEADIAERKIKALLGKA